MVPKLKYIFLIIALAAVTALGILIFSSSNLNLVLIKIFGIACLMGLLGEGICILVESNKKM
ncbi:hypothetical protein [Proteiniborus sp. MB09-C3]|uniref:hypothetical protein n=1 Tax=Proteiniborus sp. MB09-C3 TaxID=3050072 RepID=UPI0025558D32|nr:hypothetical protein [Proteiniborus sp. MB09-C3]WIV12712.1 hypothetical protein QO263_03080 [Proteiniborus sp. MB09-C3]